MISCFKRTALSVLLFGFTPYQAFSATLLYGEQGIRIAQQSSRGIFYVQVGAFKDFHHAKNLAQHYSKTLPTEIKQHGEVYRVVVGPIQKNNSQHPARHHHKPITQPSVHKRYSFPNKDVKRSNPIQPMSAKSKSQLLFKLDIAAAEPSFQKNINIPNGSNFPSPNNLDIYTTQGQTTPLVNLSVLKSFDVPTSLIPSIALGLRYQYVAPNNVGSTIELYSLPEFLNYNYNWDFSAQVLTLEARANSRSYGALTPYLNVGAGITFNQMRAYSEMPFSNVTPRFSPNFANKSSQQFAWHAGIGADYMISNRISASLGYDFEFLNRASSGQGANGWEGTALSLNNIKLNMLLVGLTYTME